MSLRRLKKFGPLTIALLFGAIATTYVYGGGCTDTPGPGQSSCYSMAGTAIKPAVCGPVPDPCGVDPGFPSVSRCACNSRPSGETYLCYCEAS